MKTNSVLRTITDKKIRESASELLDSHIEKEGSDVFLVFFQNKGNPIVLDLLYHLYMVSDLSKDPVDWKLKSRVAARGLGNDVIEYGIGISSQYPRHTEAIKKILGIDPREKDKFFLRLI